MAAPFFKKKDSVDKPLKQGMVQKVQLEELPPEDTESYEKTESAPGPVSIGKAQLDKKSLDLVFAVEQMIQARVHAETNNHELQDRLNHSSSHVERLGRDLKNLNKVIEEREKSILELEHKLVEKNLKVDQVMEDYRELHTTMSAEMDELKSTIDLEHQKYANLVQKHNDAISEKLKRMNELEEKIGRLETENGHLKQKYDTVRQEKAYLSSMISDFTNRMTLPFGGSNSPADRNDGNGDT
jgi:chromosome segregation ATPase